MDSKIILNSGTKFFWNKKVLAFSVLGK